MDNKIKEILADVFAETELDIFAYCSKLRAHAESEVDSINKNVLIVLYKVMTHWFPTYEAASDYKLHEIYVLTDEQIEVLLQMEDELVAYPVLYSRVCDVLWGKRRKYQHIDGAVNTYMTLVKALESSETNGEHMSYLKRAMLISRPLGESNRLYKNCAEYIHSAIETCRRDDKNRHVSLIEIAANYELPHLEEYLIIIDDIIAKMTKEDSGEHDDYGLVRIFNLKLGMYKILKKVDAKVHAEYASVLEAIAYRHSSERGTYHIAIQYYEDAIINYRKANMSNEANRIRKILTLIKKDYTDGMTPIEANIDISDTVDKMQAFLHDKSLQEQILTLGAVTYICAKQELEDSVIKNSRASLMHMVTKQILDRDGRTIITIPPLGAVSPTKDKALLEEHMHQEANERYNVTIFQEIVLRHIIKNNADITIEQLDFLIVNNAIIPEDRQRIFRIGLVYLFKQDIYTALHILVPQTENLFRVIAEMCGGLTTTFDNDASEQAKVLSSIFTIPELVDSYDNDILFAFQGLLNEKAGANLRNTVAHGVLNDAESGRRVELFFLCALIKILSWYTDDKCAQLAKIMREIEAIPFQTGETNSALN